MGRYDTFPDAESVASVALRNANLAGIAKRIYSSIPKEPTYPLATVKRLGGVPAERHHLDRARIQVDTWGTSKSEAHDIAQALRRTLHALEGGSVTSPKAFISAVNDSLGLTWQPDPVTGRDRYVFTVDLFLTDDG